MSLVKGLGVCLIPQHNGLPCGRQIGEGDPIGTVTVRMNPLLGHKGCADAYQQREREAAMVKRYSQQGAGGAVDFGHPEEMVQGSIPLEKSPSTPLAEVPMPDGVQPITEVPFEEPSPPSPSPSNAPEGGKPLVSPEVLATLTKETQSGAIDVEEQNALAKVRQEFATKRQLRELSTHTLKVDLSEVPPEIDVLVIQLDLRQFRS